MYGGEKKYEKIFYNNFCFHISNGPILETEIKIEGSDRRVENLKCVEEKK